MGWYDANPSNLAPMPPVETGKRYVDAMGGAARVKRAGARGLRHGRLCLGGGAAEPCRHGGRSDAEAKDLLARSYDQLGWQAEPSTWRNIYLTGAKELREGVGAPRAQSRLADGRARQPAARIADGPAGRAARSRTRRRDRALKLAFVLTDSNERTYVTIANGVLVHEEIAAPGPVDATLTLDAAPTSSAAFSAASPCPRRSRAAP